MPKGLAGVRQVSQEQKERRNSGGGGGGALFFKLEDGQEAIVRFLEQDEDIHWAWMHEVPVEGRSWGQDVPCLDQEKDGTACPGCDRDLKRAFKGYINLIWFDAPEIKRDAEGKAIKEGGKVVFTGNTKPQVAVWNSGIRLFEDLEEINANYKGLTSRRFKVKRKGIKLDTKYVIVPADIDSGPQDFDETERKLREAKNDLNPFVTPPSYDEWLKKLGAGGGSSESSNGSEGGAAQSANPFMRNR